MKPVLHRLSVAARLTAAAALAGAAVIAVREASPAAESRLITGPYAALLAASTDLGPAGAESVQLTAALHGESRPERLMAWAQQRGLSVRWGTGHPWAEVDGPADAVEAAFGVTVHDFRGRRGQAFYASREQPRVPDALSGEVAGLGRILSFTPFHDAHRWMLPQDVPGIGLGPEALLRTYQVESLAKRGFTGKGMTVVVFAFDGFDQADLDMFTSTFGLPPFTPEVVGEIATQRSGEATMDLEAVHAIAPDAKTVLINARQTISAAGPYEKIAAMMDDAEIRFPGAVWSFSIGWGCDKLITAADLEPVRTALRAAHGEGTTSFNASGDLAGLECKGGENWSTPPGPDEIGLDAVASVPEMTDVGGTGLSTDVEGTWLSEQSWFDVPISQGTGGGVSNLFDRPEWQGQLKVPGQQRLTPDISAVADPETGVKFVFNRAVFAGGGTSLAAPIWAGITAVLDQYLVENGGRLIGDFNPMLYEVAQGAQLPGFRDVTLGGNAVDDAVAGYDLVTGLGTPNVGNLAEDLLAIQRTWKGVR